MQYGYQKRNLMLTWSPLKKVQKYSSEKSYQQKVTEKLIFWYFITVFNLFQPITFLVNFSVFFQRIQILHGT
jgi:hypothetical protein